MRAWPRGKVTLAGLLAASAALAALGALTAMGKPLLGLGLGLAFGAGVFWGLAGRYVRRVRMTREPFPDAWRRILEKRVTFYRRLPDEQKRRFEDDVRFFLAEQRIFGEGGQPVDEEIRLLVAASAAMLCHGKPDFEWPTLRDIVVYRNAFKDGSYEVGPDGNVIGMVHQQGPIIFSGPHLRRGFRKPTDGRNVGLHELAHVLDMEDGAADGVPGDLAWAATAPWVEHLTRHLEHPVRDRLRRLLGDYAYTNEAEMFAVLVEVFFERPSKLQARDPELYDLLCQYFNLDPRTGRLLREPEAS